MPKAKILLVEPDKDLCMPFTTWLKSGGYEARLAYTPEEAYSLLSKDRFDMLMVDIDSSDTTGDLIGFCRTVKKDERLSGLPITTLVHRNNGKRIAEALKGGADRFIPKPFNTKYFIECMKEIFREIESEKAGRKGLDLNYLGFLTEKIGRAHV